MAYTLGSASLARLHGVRADLVAVVQKAIQITDQDFAVMDGLRTMEQQRVLVAKGASKTLNSKHLQQPDGFGHAVDLVPFINGQPRWEWPPIYHIAAAVSVAARELKVELTWGGVWDRPLLSLASSPLNLEQAVHSYSVRHLGPDLLDGPHYQLVDRP